MANERSGFDASSIDWSFAASQAYLPPRSPLFGTGASAAAHDNNSFFTSNWPKIPHPSTHGNRRHHQRTPSTSFLPQTPAWVDDLLNDAPDLPPPKNLHRRSSSDSLAFLEAPLQHVRITNMAEDEEAHSGNNARLLLKEFKPVDKVSEDWLLPKVSGIGASQVVHANANARVSLPENKAPFDTSSALSDQDSANGSSMEDKITRGIGVQSKHDAEVQSALKAEHSPSPAANGEASSDATLDPKRAKRILANRQSAQRSRVRKLQYIAELERTVNALQEEVSALSPQVTYLDRHRIILNVDNSTMKQRIAALAQEKLFKDAHNEAMKAEVHRLRQLYQQQQKLVQQSGLTFENNPSQFNFQVSSQLDLKDLDVGLDVAKCIDFVFKENDANSLESHAPPRSPSLKPTIGPSSCSTSEKGKGFPGIEQFHSDCRVQNS